MFRCPNLRRPKSWRRGCSRCMQMQQRHASLQKSVPLRLPHTPAADLSRQARRVVVQMVWLGAVFRDEEYNKLFRRTADYIWSNQAVT